MKVQTFLDALQADFFAGVPDSQLRPLCDYLMDHYGISKEHHMIAANEGNCVALAAGYHLATGKVPVVYMQNSGEGNIVNPVASLLNDKVYAIPMIFVVGWRGEPGVHDEPQHIYQGEITVELLKVLDIESFIIDKNTTEEDLAETMKKFVAVLETGKSVAFVVRKNALEYDKKVKYANKYEMSREEIIQHIVKVSGEDPIVSTTGKASRELFETRVALGQSNQYDFLTVGSMGHSSSIALGVAIQKNKQKIWCVDGDGAALMHMGAMAVIGANRPENLVHVLINNGAHETVGGMPTVGENVDWPSVAKAVGYPNAVTVSDNAALDNELQRAKERNELSFIEVKCAIGARDDLGRPTSTSLDNKKAFMSYLNQLD